jgi:hypothetical protein
MDVFAPALDYTARHPSIRLAFEAAAEAAEAAANTASGHAEVSVTAPASAAAGTDV